MGCHLCLDRNINIGNANADNDNDNNSNHDDDPTYLSPIVVMNKNFNQIKENNGSVQENNKTNSKFSHKNYQASLNDLKESIEEDKGIVIKHIDEHVPYIDASPLNTSNISKEIYKQEDDDNEEEEEDDNDEYDNIKANNESPNKKTKVEQPQPYITLTSTSINVNSNNNNNDKGGNTLQDKEKTELALVLLTQCCIVFYFEIKFFKLWNAEYLYTVYPEGDLFMCILIDEDQSTYEKVQLTKSRDSKEKKLYIPISSSSSKASFSIIKCIKHLQASNLPHKIIIQLTIMTQGKMILVSENKFFIMITAENDLKKYPFYLNSDTVYANKKVGNASFTIMYHIDAIENLMKPTNEKMEEYEQLFKSSNDVVHYNENPSLQLIYYNIENIAMRKKIRNDFNTFDTENPLNDYYDIDKLSKEKNNIENLLNVLKSINIMKYDLYEVLMKLNVFLSKMAFDNDKIQLYKEALFKLNADIIDNKESWDRIVLPYLFHTYRKVIFRSKKSSMKQSMNTSTNGNSNGGSRKGSIQTYLIPDIYLSRHTEITFSLFQSAFIFLENDVAKEITFAALNFISKNIQDSHLLNHAIEISSRGVTQSSIDEDQFINHILSTNQYDSICKLLLYYNDEPECVLPTFLIINTLLKSKRNERNSLVTLLQQDKFKQSFTKIGQLHSCNSLIMNGLFCILQSLSTSLSVRHIVDIISLRKIREVFTSFKLSFDILHESVIFLIRMLLKANSERLQKKDITVSNFNNDSYEEIIEIFSAAVRLIRNKIQGSPHLMKIITEMNGYLKNIFTCCSIVNNINEVNIVSIAINKHFGDHLIDCLSTMNDKGFFANIDMIDKRDISSLIIKTMVFRVMYHCLILFEKMLQINKTAINVNSIKKLINVIKTIEDNAQSYNPDIIKKKFLEVPNENMKKGGGSKIKPNDFAMKHLEGLKDYSQRYQAKVKELKELFKTKTK